MTPGRGVRQGEFFLALPYYSQREVFASLWALFSLSHCVHSSSVIWHSWLGDKNGMWPIKFSHRQCWVQKDLWEPNLTWSYLRNNIPIRQKLQQQHDHRHSDTVMIMSVYCTDINRLTFQYVTQALRLLWIESASRRWQWQLTVVCTASIHTFTDWWCLWLKHWSNLALK